MVVIRLQAKERQDKQQWQQKWHSNQGNTASAGTPDNGCAKHGQNRGRYHKATAPNARLNRDCRALIVAAVDLENAVVIYPKCVVVERFPAVHEVQVAGAQSVCC